MGDQTAPRRTPQVGHHRQQPLDSALPLARTEARAEPDLAHVPAQPCPPSWAVDLLTLTTLTFKTLYVLVFIAHGRRELVHVNVTANPTAAWVWRQIIEATPWGQEPRHLLRDRDAVYGHDFRRRARRIGIDAIATPIHAPKAKACASNCSSWVRWDAKS